MSRYDEIEEVMKSEEEPVEKFNPFHDSRGRFSNSHGFSTYSANPKKKAGQMAIQRSAAAGHGSTLNVHAESKGENIAQNDKWIRTGKKPTTPAMQQSWRPSVQQYQQYKQNQAQNRKNKKNPAQQNQQNQQNQQAQQDQQDQQNQAQQAAQKPAATGSLSANVAGVTVTAKETLAMQPRDRRGGPVNTRELASDNYQDRVAGKDISKSVDIRNISGGQEPIDKIAIAQGWNQNPTVTNDKAVFDAACKQSGRVMVRSVHDDWGSGMSADQVATETMTNGSTSLGGSGGKAYGSGMYVVDYSIKNGVNAKDMAWAQRESYCYGDRQMMATVHPSAKIATPTQASQLSSEFWNLPKAEQKRFSFDENSYIASKGYDGAKWMSDTDPTAYTTMYNKSAMIFYGGVADR